MEYPSDIQLYYDMLDSGLRLGVWGGTDLMGNDRAVGHTRTYARVGRTAELAAWTRARGAGHTFATNHPLVYLDVDGKGPGDEIAGTGRLRVRARIRLETAYPVGRLRLVRDGATAREIEVGRDQRVAELSEELSFERSGWIAAAAYDATPGDGLFDQASAWAHTSPVYVTIAGAPAAIAPGPERMVRHMDTALAWLGSQGRFTSEASRAAALASFQAARDVYVRAAERSR
jgi:hypothetical protein